MRAMLWRVVYAALAVFMFWLIVPMFLIVVGFTLPGNVLALMHVCLGCLAVLYVLFGPTPPAPW